MIDIVGNIKIDESRPERIKYLIACIRSYHFLKDSCSFILNIDGASPTLFDKINEELKMFHRHHLTRETADNYGTLYCQLLAKGSSDFVLNFLEDHFCLANDDKQIKNLLTFMNLDGVDVCKASFFEVEQKSIRNINSTISGAEGKIFLNNEEFHNAYQQHYGLRYYIGVNFITTKKFAHKFWNRTEGARPHAYEISVYDRNWEHKILFPSFEITESVDDNHGEDGTCLLERTDCKKWNIIWSELRDVELFHIPSHTIVTKRFSNLLHDRIVNDFEYNFSHYVGAQHAVSINSATNAIFLSLLGRNDIVYIPSVIPPVVANAILLSGNKVAFSDNVNWVGSSYTLHRCEDYKIVDSAQRVERDQYKNRANPKTKDLMIFSFYPTKPVSGCDGGIIVSDSEQMIENIRELSFNGMSFAKNNWERQIKRVGYKMYMNSLQAYIANENLKKLEHKKEKLFTIRGQYNHALALDNKSDHLYRINVKNNRDFIASAKMEGIICGIHYNAIHHNPVYGCTQQNLPLSDTVSRTTVSIPFHEDLTQSNVLKIIKFIKRNK